jgi:hypothetical protein
MSHNAWIFAESLTSHHSWLFAGAVGSAVGTLGSAVWALTVARRGDRDELRRARNRLARLEAEISSLTPIAESALSDMSLADSPDRVKEATELRNALTHMDEALQKLLRASEDLRTASESDVELHEPPQP